MRSPAFWYPASSPTFSDKALRLALSPAAALYAAGAKIRQRMTVPERVSVPVFCVGNFTAGGAGKTPTAIALANRLIAMGETPHFVSRGYGGREVGPTPIDVDRHSSEDVGDEPLLLREHAPTWVSKDRVAGALAAERAGASVILLDDGFQNPALHKDLSLVVVDTGVGIGNGAVLPAGPLRERLSLALERTDGIVALGPSPLSTELVNLADQASIPIFNSHLEPASAHLSELADERLIAFAGIGRPEKFFSTLRDLGAKLVDTRTFPDHHPFSEKDAETLLALAASENVRLITTAKDAVRLRALAGNAGKRLLGETKVLPVRAVFDDLPGLDKLLTQHLTAARASHTYAPPGTRRN